MRTTARAASLVLLLPLVWASTATAQPSDESEIRAVVENLFDAMREGDGGALAALFHPDATLKSVGLSDGAAQVRHEQVDAFAAQVGAPRDEVLDERIFNVEIRRDGPFAIAWMEYSFYVDDRFSHCGVNAFELVRAEGGWLILGITDTRRTTGCE
jgi:uncharacterized protein (TIGR02246 family)